MMRAITPDLKSTWVGTSHWHLTSRNFCPAAKNRVAERALAKAGTAGHGRPVIVALRREGGKKWDNLRRVTEKPPRR